MSEIKRVVRTRINIIALCDDIQDKTVNHGSRNEKK